MVEIVKDGIHRKVDESRLPDWKAKGYVVAKDGGQKGQQKKEPAKDGGQKE